MALAALLIAGYLTVVSLNEGARPAGCGPDSACEQVLGSKWSKWLGVVPVSATAVVLYALTIAGTVFLGPETLPLERRRGWIMLTLAAVMIAGAAAWFVFLQAIVIKNWCAWCMSGHGLGVTLAALIVCRAPFGRGRAQADSPAPVGAITPPMTGIVVVAGLVAVGLVPVGQVLVESKPATSTAWLDEIATQPSVATARPAVPNRKGIVWAMNGQLRFDLAKPMMPLVGKADAEFVVIEVFDYCCGHCRITQPRIATARKRYGEQLAFVVMPMPLNSDCNRTVRKTQPGFEQACDLARLSLAVWSADRKSFAAMHEWLFEGEKAPSAKDARARAIELVGLVDLQVALADPLINEQIRKNIDLHERTSGKDNKTRFLPKFILRRGVFTGVPKEQLFFDALESIQGVKPVQKQ